jgi:hypothetical protein
MKVNKVIKNIGKKTSKTINNVKGMRFGSLDMDSDTKMGLITLFVILLIGLLLKNIISEFIQKVFIFGLIFVFSLLSTKNMVISVVLTCILYFIWDWVSKNYFKQEGFKNKKKKKNVVKEEEDEDEEDNEEEGDEEDEKENFEDLEDTNKNLVNEPVTERENDDMDVAVQNLEQFGEMLDGKIKIKKSDKKVSKPLNIDFRNTKYSEEPTKYSFAKAQKETYELMNTMKTLQDTIKTMSPLLTEGHKVMSMFDNFKIDK